jgi:hypothetical protein
MENMTKGLSIKDDGGTKHLWNVGKLLPDYTQTNNPEDSNLHYLNC